jgi:PAS domain S-box-containing protein
MRWFQRRGFRYSLVVGLLFGGATLVGMSTPLVHRPGLIYDGRSIVLGIAGLFAGPLAAAVAALMAVLFRLQLGGPGALTGVLVILESALLGAVAHRLRQRWPGLVRPLPLLGLGGLIHLIMMALMALLPGGAGPGVFRSLGLVILVGYPLGFMAVGLAYVELERHFLMERALKESEEKFRTLFERSTVGMAMVDHATGRFMEVNEAALRPTGYTRQEFLGLSYWDLTPREFEVRQRGLIEDLDRVGWIESQEKEYIRKDGGRCPVRISAFLLPGDQGRKTAWGIIEDITERKRAEEELCQSRADLQLLLDSAAEGIYGIDLDGKCTSCNQACLQMTGYASADQVLGRNMHELIHHSFADGRPFPEDECWIFRAFQEGRGSHVEEEMLWRADGTCFAAECWAYPQLRQGRVVGAVVTFIDITERKRAAEERERLQAHLNQAQKLESLGSLAGGVAHDMNNVLGAILGLASAHAESQPPESPVGQALRTIVKAAERGGKMVKGLLGFARRTPVETQTVDVNDLLQEQVHLLERTTLSKMAIHLDLEEGLAPILGDGGALSHAIMNLCVNAVDAMAEGGSLTLRTRRAEPGWIAIHVEDAGTGMPKEVLDRALDPFFTTKEQGKGTGLGLSMVHSTVKAHGGQLEIDSRPGRGTTVILRLPESQAAEAGNPPPESLASQAPVEGNRALQVLVIDDDELILSTMEAMLDLLGHAGTLVQSGEEALARLESGLRPDAVILDMNMPGLDGTQTLQRLRVLCPAVPVFLATGRADQVALDLVAGDRNMGLLSKPFTPGDLKKGFEGMIQQRPA